MVVLSVVVVTPGTLLLVGPLLVIPLLVVACWSIGSAPILVVTPVMVWAPTVVAWAPIIG